MEVSEISRSTVDKAFERMDEHVVDMAEQTIIDESKNCALNHKKVFDRRSIRKAQRDLLASISHGNTGTREILEAAIVQVPRTSNLTKEVAKTLVNDPNMLAPMRPFVIDMSDKAAG